MMPGFYNHNYQIIQTRDYVVISVEMIHDARIIPLDGAAARPGLNQWLGNSRGHFEGNTLVVETTGFRRIDQRNVAVFGTSERGRVIERFTPTGPESMDYQSPSTIPRSTRDPGRPQSRCRRSRDRCSSTRATRATTA